MTDATAGFTGFGPDLLEFYEGLAADNTRAWWGDHEAVHDEQVGGPAKALAAALEGEFGPVKVFRPHRDVRFSHDKTPYETSLTIAGGRDDARTVRSMDSLLAGLDGAGFSMMQEGALRTAPRGWSRDHPRIGVLRLRHLVVGQDREPGPWLAGAGCLDAVAAAWRTVGRWNAWLEEHVGVPLEAAGPSGTDAPR